MGECVCGCGRRQSAGPDDYEWRFEHSFPLSHLLQNDPAVWSEWWADEKFVRDTECTGSGQDLEDWWASGDDARLEEPLILVLDREGAGHIWDGAHRTGISFSRGILRVPAIVGVPKEEV